MVRNWSLYNKEEKIRIDDLSVEQIHTILLAISTARMPHWYACQEGDLHWQNICDIPEFYEDTRQAKGDSYLPKVDPTQPPPKNAQGEEGVKRRPLFEDAPEETQNSSTLAMEAAIIRERRSARRYALRLRFRTPGYEGTTKDVSMSGLSLEKPLPSDIPRRFRAELIFNGVSLGLTCQKVSDHQLKIVDADMWEVLKQWIISW